MSERKPGRPAEGKTVSKEAILSEAVTLLKAEGVDGITMRALAVRAGINPMTIYHHFKDRHGLIRALAELVYAEVIAPSSGGPLERASGLLTAYQATVLVYPSLTLAIFAHASVFPDQARRITQELIDLLSARGLSSERALLWAHILIDYTHGMALAEGVQTQEVQRNMGLSDFERGLMELLKAVEHTVGDCGEQT